MAYVADLHIHSKYAQACSGALNIPNLSEWASWKGINLVGTGDCLHPIYLQELKRDLKDNGNGTYSNGNTKFLLTTEVACIYSEQGRGRRIHIIIMLPSLDNAFKLNEVLTKQGAKLGSDGRPVIGMSIKKLCEIVFQVSPKAILIPAHCWTPWYGLYGSKSGYDKFNDCFGDFSNEVFAIETGLSSDPAMNWRIGDLDNKSIVSFSDLHSLPRLGRECTIFAGELSFKNLRDALKNQNILGTIEFFPEEGKYHYSGHRNCGIVYSPQELEKNGKICPKCHRELTIGVLQRIEELATRTVDELQIIKEDGVIKSKTFPKRPGFRMLIQLEEIIAESLGSSVSSQKTKDEYKRLVTNLDPELKILTKTKLELIAMTAGEKLAEGIKRVRENNLSIEPGYDNTYGVVKIWNEEEEKTAPPEEQMGLF